MPCRTIGITGSAGKTTTTTLVGQMAKNPCGDKAYVGGNIGDPLINYVDNMKADDIAILELSSFQLEQMTISPNIAAILNITPNHLDRHGTMEAYTAAKARLLDFQSDQDIAVLGRDDKGAWDLRDKVKGKLFTFSLHELEEGLNGAYLQEGLLKSARWHTLLATDACVKKFQCVVTTMCECPGRIHDWTCGGFSAGCHARSCGRVSRRTSSPGIGP